MLLTRMAYMQVLVGAFTDVFLDHLHAYTPTSISIHCKLGIITLALAFA